MVLSGDSLSLELPLDMSAAMEKALAREESCGLGGGVYSMATARGRGSVRRCPDGAGGRAGPAGGGGAGIPGALCSRRRALPRLNAGPRRSYRPAANRRRDTSRAPARPGPAAGEGAEAGSSRSSRRRDGQTEGGEEDEGRALPPRRVGRGRPALGTAPRSRSPFGHPSAAPRRGPGCGSGSAIRSSERRGREGGGRPRGQGCSRERP